MVVLPAVRGLMRLSSDGRESRYLHKWVIVANGMVSARNRT